MPIFILHCRKFSIAVLTYNKVKQKISGIKGANFTVKLTQSDLRSTKI